MDDILWAAMLRVSVVLGRLEWKRVKDVVRRYTREQ